ncbi:MAG: SufS family cysteine desulfurase [Clostridiales bacterium]|nr:SufS family cysteine desulfurase [Clostridiales bacterium]
MQDYRKDFPIFKSTDCVYLDNAATSQRPQSVIDAVSDFYAFANANPLRGLYDLSMKATEKYESSRKKVASFIGAGSADEIIFTRNTTESINLASYSYGDEVVNEGDEIVISVMEHHSNLLPWQRLAKEKKARLVFMEPDESGVISDKEIEEKIGTKTKIVAIAQVSNVMGIRNPVEKIIERAHSKGAVVLVDGAQSVPHMRVNVTELDADMFAFSSHKMMGPMGIGVLYVKKRLMEKMKPFLMGGEMIEYVTREDATFAELPHKFEAGTVNAADACGLDAAIDYLNNVGYDYIEKRDTELVTKIMQGMKEMGHITIYGSGNPCEHNGIVTFNVEGVHPHDVSSVLNEDGVCIRAGHHCAQPLMQFLNVGSTARASVYFYNTEDEIDRFLDCLSKVRKVMGYGS